MYIYELKDWPHFRWNQKRLSKSLTLVAHKQGRLIGRMESLGFKLRAEASLQTLTEDVVKSSEIEGEFLDREQVRSSIARRLGMNVGGLTSTERHVDGVVEMVLDATQLYDAPLTAERLFAWHSALFPTGRSGMAKITVGGWRTDQSGPMQVISGHFGRERLHFQAPPAARVEKEMETFLEWHNLQETGEILIKAGIAHLWFVTIHPFDDGNGRIARAISDQTLACSEKSSQRFYSMSTQIRKQRSEYYDVLEQTQKGNLDVTLWLEWFLGCLDDALDGAESTLGAVLRKARFGETLDGESFNGRQRIILNLLIDGFQGKMTSSKWAKLGKCSQDTALRDIDDLIRRDVLTRDAPGGRSTSYSLKEID
ncbi:MAG: Fic family protein [Pseudomonadota bacterium]